MEWDSMKVVSIDLYNDICFKNQMWSKFFIARSIEFWKVFSMGQIVVMLDYNMNMLPT